MPGHSRPKDGVASLAYVPGVHALLSNGKKKDVDGRNKSGHDVQQHSDELRNLSPRPPAAHLRCQHGAAWAVLDLVPVDAAADLP